MQCTGGGQVALPQTWIRRGFHRPAVDPGSRLHGTSAQRLQNCSIARAGHLQQFKGLQKSSMAPALDNPCVLASSAAYPAYSYTQAEVLDAVSRQNNFPSGMHQADGRGMALAASATHTGLIHFVCAQMRCLSASGCSRRLRSSAAISLCHHKILDDRWTVPRLGPICTTVSGR